jgi:hypothetical protein
MLDLKSHIVNDELIINKFDWQKLNSQYSQDEIKEAISEAITGLPLPLIQISEEEAKKDFCELEKFDASSLFRKGDLYTKADYKYGLSNWYLNNSLIGRKSPNYYHQLERWKTQHARYPSPYRSWTELKFHKTFLNPLWTLNMGEVNNKTLRMSIQMRKYLASQYPPAVAKAIYNTFGAKNVLDFSMGWGDRLAGFHASNAESYTGIDPNVGVFVNYPRQNELCETYKKTEFINAPAEDVDLEDRKFDMVFTSPPYFHVERYSFGQNEETQSWKRYGKSMNDWLNGFLFPTLEKCWNTLNDGGTMIINIADVHAAEKGKNVYLQICDPMNDFINSLSNSNYSGCFGLKLSKRPQSNNDTPESKNKTIVEPMWVWKKSDDRLLDEIIDNSFPLSKFFM